MGLPIGHDIHKKTDNQTAVGMKSKSMNVERIGYSVDEIVSAYGVSEALIRSEIRKGNLRGFRIRRRVVVQVQDFHRYLSTRRT